LKQSSWGESIQSSPSLKAVDFTISGSWTSCLASEASSDESRFRFTGKSQMMQIFKDDYLASFLHKDSSQGKILV
jgi:hypothetical protein